MNKMLQENDGLGNPIQIGQVGILNTGVSEEIIETKIRDLRSEITSGLSVASVQFNQRIDTLLTILYRALEDGDARSKFAPMLSDPGFAMATRAAIEGYAKTGEAEHASVLVSLLIERSGVVRFSRQQIALNEAITCVPRLTDEHIAAITLVFLLRDAVFNSAENFGDLFSQLIDAKLAPLFDKIERCKRIDARHMISVGAADLNTAPLVNFSLHNQLVSFYPHIFTQGFSIAEVDAIFGSPFPKDLLRSVVDEKYSLKCTKQRLVEIASQYGLDEESVKKVYALQDQKKMDEKEFEELMSRNNSTAKLLRLWNGDGYISKLQLTSVGLALGYNNASRLYPDFREIAKLETWIPA